MAFFAATTIAMLVGGFVVPRNNVVTRSQEFSLNAQQLWELIRDFQSYKEWRTGIISIDYSEPAENGTQLARWREVSSTSSISFGVVTEQPPVFLEARVLDEDLHWSGKWVFEVHDNEEQGSTLRLTQYSTIANPIVRFYSACFSTYDKAISQYLNDLKSLAARM